jgi:GNAT superfamily N-acetyltransferase
MSDTHWLKKQLAVIRLSVLSDEEVDVGAQPILREDPFSDVTVRLFRPGDEKDFRRLNEAWIAKYFGIESADEATFADPQHKIIEPGGQIFLAFLDGVAVGTVGMRRMSGASRSYELIKMATDERYQRRGIARAVVEAAIKWARQQKAKRLYLETNSSLIPAITLYESVGFKHMPPQPTPYKRADVFMEMWLEPEWLKFI